MSDQNGIIGKRLKTYEIQSLVGRGGMASVFKAFDHNLQREVAIKVLSAHAALQHGFADRFRQEALLIARLHHPNIVQVYDYSEQDGLTFMVEELLPGPTLSEQIAQANANGVYLPREQVLKIVRDVASGLEAAHRAGIIHRDIKPDNAIWNARGDLVLTDFGIARVLTAADAGYTQTGTIVGTPNYMSPEQAQGLPLTSASDAYSLGVVLYELLAGQVPFSGNTPISVVMDHVQKPPPPLRRRDLPPAVESVVMQALAKDPAKRFAGPLALADALERAWPPAVSTGIHQQPTTVWPPQNQAARPAAQTSDAYAASNATNGPRIGLLLGLIGGLALLLLCGAAMAARGFFAGSEATPTPVTIVDVEPSVSVEASPTVEATVPVAPSLTPEATAPPTETPVSVPVGLTKPIVFQSQRTGDWDLFSVNPDGSGLRQLTDSGADDVSPSWAPDALSIAFQSNRSGREQIFLMNLDGGNQRNITNNRYDNRDPVWSPDGQFIAYYARPNGNWNIFVMNADGSNPRAITSDLSDEFLPAWSPDGQWIAFTSNAGKNDEVNIIRPDGSDRRVIASSPAGDKYPAWAPDSRHLAFASDREGNSDIYVVDIDGNGLQNLTNNPAGDTQPNWSTDGLFITFVTNRDGRAQVYVMNADGSDQRNLSNDAKDDSEPSWAR